MGDYTGLEQFACWMIVIPFFVACLGVWEKRTGIKIGGVWEVVVDVTPWKGIILWMIFWSCIIGVSQSCRGVPSVRDRYRGAATAPTDGRNPAPTQAHAAPTDGPEPSTQTEAERLEEERHEEDLVLLEEQHWDDEAEARRDTIWTAIVRLEDAGVVGRDVRSRAIGKALKAAGQPPLDEGELRLLGQSQRAPTPWGEGPSGAELRLERLGDSEEDELLAALEKLDKPAFLLSYAVTVATPKDEHELVLPNGRGWVRVDERGVLKIQGRALTREPLKKAWRVGKRNRVSIHADGRRVVVHVNGVRVGPVDLASPRGDGSWSLRSSAGTRLSSLLLVPERTRAAAAHHAALGWVLDQQSTGCSQPTLDPFDLSWSAPDAPQATLRETLTVFDGCIRRTRALHLSWAAGGWEVAPSDPVDAGSCTAPCAPAQTKQLAGAWDGDVQFDATLTLRADGHFEHFETFEGPPFAPEDYENSRSRAGRWDARGGRVTLFYADGSAQSLVEARAGSTRRLQGENTSFTALATRR